MEVNLEHYRVFREVADKLSFSAAANALFITQPAVSQTITALERSLGVTLFARTSKGVVLTTEGKHLYSYVDRALKTLKAGEDKLSEVSRLECGEVKIAAADTISKHFLLPILETYHRNFPHININVINRTTADCIELLKSASADLAFVNLPIKNVSGLNIHSCIEIQDIFVAGNKFAELKNESLKPSELADLPLLLLEQKSNSRRYIDEYFIKQSIAVTPAIELGSYDLLLEFSKIGLGVSCVIREFSMKYLDSGELFEVRLSPGIKPRHIGMAHVNSIPLSKSAGEFVKLVHEMI